MLDGGGHLLHRGGGFLERARLFRGPLREILVTVRDLLGGGCDVLDCVTDGAQRACQVLDRLVEADLDLVELALIASGHVLGEIPRG